MGGNILGALNPMNLIQDAMSALKDVGQTLEDVGSGNIGNLGQDLGKDFGDITKLGTDVASFTNPEMAPFLQMAQPLLGGLAQQAGGMAGGASGSGGFDPLQLLGNPSPFGLGNLIPGLANNPFQGLPNFSGGGGGGVQDAANSWPSQAANAAGGKSWGDLQNEMKQAEASGDPAQLAKAQHDMDQYTQFVQMISQADKAQHDAMAAIIRNVSA